MKERGLTSHAVILAGGRGTRFWPRSRMRLPKQLLNIVGKKTMLEQTVERLAPAFPAARMWTVTNAEQAQAVRKQVPAAARKRVLVEPIGRNTAVAIGLAAIHVRREAGGDALLAVLPADHYIANAKKYVEILRAALDAAREPGRMVVLGIPPTRPETGFGYVERVTGATALESGGFPLYAVQRFTEKPELEDAVRYVQAGRYDWNAGMFFWRVSTFLENLRKFLPKTHAALEELAQTIGTRKYDRTLEGIYPKLENISVDYALLEPGTRQSGPPSVFVIPAEVGWSDIGSWEAVYELLARQAGENVSAGAMYSMDAEGNFFWSPDRFVAAIGVKDLIVVETGDALLICPRRRAQDVGKIVKWLEANKQRGLL